MTARDHRHFADQRTYTTTTVEAYLPAVWDPEWILRNRPRRAAETGVRSKVDPRHVPDHLVSAADVQVAFRRARLSHQEKECLRHVYHLGFTPGELSNVWDVASEVIHGAAQSGIERITRYLNGLEPK